MTRDCIPSAGLRVRERTQALWGPQAEAAKLDAAIAANLKELGYGE